MQLAAINVGFFNVAFGMVPLALMANLPEHGQCGALVQRDAQTVVKALEATNCSTYLIVDEYKCNDQKTQHM